MGVVLFHAPPSFYSQIARLTLVEKGVPFEKRVVMAGPPLNDAYDPWYLKLNPMGTVPTLVDGDDVFADSRHILDRYFPDQDDEVRRWVDLAYSIPERTLTYGRGPVQKVGARVNGMRRRAVEKRRAKHPDMRAIYDAKLADLEAFTRDTADPAAVEGLWQRLRSALDELDAALAARAFITGDDYTAADVVWTVAVARQIMNGDDPLAGRPSLAKWYGRMKARPSWTGASVWDRFHPSEMARAAFSKLKWHLLAAAVALGATTAAGVWLLSG
jgi:glutathione S-transferase